MCSWKHTEPKYISVQVTKKTSDKSNSRYTRISKNMEQKEMNRITPKFILIIPQCPWVSDSTRRTATFGCCLGGPVGGRRVGPSGRNVCWIGVIIRKLDQNWANLDGSWMTIHGCFEHVTFSHVAAQQKGAKGGNHSGPQHLPGEISRWQVRNWSATWEPDWKTGKDIFANIEKHKIVFAITNRTGGLHGPRKDW